MAGFAHMTVKIPKGNSQTAEARAMLWAQSRNCKLKRPLKRLPEEGFPLGATAGRVVVEAVAVLTWGDFGAMGFFSAFIGE